MYSNNGMVDRLLTFPYSVALILSGIIAGSVVILYLKNKGSTLVTSEANTINDIGNAAKDTCIDVINRM